MLGGCGASPAPKSAAAPAPPAGYSDAAFIHVLRTDGLLTPDSQEANRDKVRLAHAVCDYISTTHDPFTAADLAVGGGNFNDYPWDHQESVQFVTTSVAAYCPQNRNL